MTQINGQQPQQFNNELLTPKANPLESTSAAQTSNETSIFYSTFEEKGSANGKIELTDTPTSVFMNNGQSLQTQDVPENIKNKMADFDANAKYKESLTSLFQEFSYDTSKTTEESDNIVRQNLNEQIKTINLSVQNSYNQALETAKLEAQKELEESQETEEIEMSEEEGNTVVDSSIVKNEDGTQTQKLKLKNGSSITTNYDSEGKPLSQTTSDKDGNVTSKTIMGEDGQEHSVTYDSEGNTTGIVVQNGESISALAKKFGCTNEEIIAANKDLVKGKNGQQYFLVGAEIKIPKKLEPDDENLTNRKSSQESKQAYENWADNVKAQSGAVDLKDYSKTVEYGGKKYTVVGGTGNRGRSIVKGEDGKYHTMSHDGKILKDSYAMKTKAFDAGEKQTINGKEYVVVADRNDGRGRKIAVDNMGNEVILSHDNKILKTEYVVKTDTADAIKRDPQVAKKETMRMLQNQVSSAEEAFNQQLADDGWAGDLADGISVLWGSENRASKVREDLKEYKEGLELLKGAKSDTEFQTQFKAMFGVNYNPTAIAEYEMNPTEANYKKAFGTKNDIAQRVAKYNESQQTGAAVIKTTAKIGAGIAVGIATGGTGFVALGVAAAGTAIASGVIEETDRMQITGRYTDASGKKVDTTGVFREGTDHGQIWTDAAWDGASVMAGGVVGKGVKAIVKGKEVVTTAGKTVEMLTKSQKFQRLVYTTAGDVGTGAIQEKLQTGDITLNGTLTNAVTSSIGSAVELGAFSSAKTRITKMFKHTDSSPHIDIDANAPKATPVTTLGTATKASTDTGIANPRSVGKLNDTKFAQIQSEITEQLSNIKSLDSPDLATLEKQVDALSDRSQRKSLQNLINARRQELTNRPVTVPEFDNIPSVIGSTKGLSDEIKQTFSIDTQKLLSNVKEGESVIASHGNVHYLIKNENGQIKIANVINDAELCRVAGNNGKVLDYKYVQNSMQAKDFLNNSINSGSYTSSLDSYISTLNEAHRLSYSGANGNNKYYMKNGQLLEMTPGQIRQGRGLQNNYANEANEISDIAKQYGDKFSSTNTSEVQKVKLAGIPDDACPANFGTEHYYPEGKALNKYFEQMHRTAKEAVDLIESGASETQILKKLAEHYQYAANCRPYTQINNSLFMNELNTLLQKAGMRTMPHGKLDHVAMRLQPDAFERYFIDQYKKTAVATPERISTPVSKPETPQVSTASHNNEPTIIPSQDPPTRILTEDPPTSINLSENNHIYASDAKKGKSYSKGQAHKISSDEALLIGNQKINVSDLFIKFKDKINALKEGEHLILGRNDFAPNDLTISRKHIIIQCDHGEFKITDISTNGVIHVSAITLKQIINRAGKEFTKDSMKEFSAMSMEEDDNKKKRFNPLT